MESRKKCYRENLSEHKEKTIVLHSCCTWGSYSISFRPKLFRRIWASVQPPEVHTARRWYVSDAGHTCISPLIAFQLTTSQEAKNTGTEILTMTFPKHSCSGFSWKTDIWDMCCRDAGVTSVLACLVTFSRSEVRLRRTCSPELLYHKCQV